MQIKLSMGNNRGKREANNQACRGQGCRIQSWKHWFRFWFRFHRKRLKFAPKDQLESGHTLDDRSIDADAPTQYSNMMYSCSGLQGKLMEVSHVFLTFWRERFKICLYDCSTMFVDVRARLFLMPQVLRRSKRFCCFHIRKAPLPISRIVSCNPAEHREKIAKTQENLEIVLESLWILNILSSRDVSTHQNMKRCTKISIMYRGDVRFGSAV